MAISSRRDGPDQMTVIQSGSFVARLFGLPFSAIGIYFLYHLVMGLVPGHGELTVAGIVILPIMTAAFLVPGWILILGRKLTTIDLTRREIVEVRDFIVHRRQQVSSIAEARKVLVKRELSRSSSSSSGTSSRALVQCVVSIALDGDRDALLAVFGTKNEEETRALSLGQEVAAFTGLPFEDARAEEDADEEEEDEQA